MKTFAERSLDRGKLRRPTEWAPNGCGPAALGPVDPVPDDLAGVDFSDCCDGHDLDYYRGGFLGLFTRKPKADIGLAGCMARRFYAAAAADWRAGGAVRRAKAAGKAALGTVAAPIYFAAVTILGWTPFTWPWRRRPLPSGQALNRIKEALVR